MRDVVVITDTDPGRHVRCPPEAAPARVFAGADGQGRRGQSCASPCPGTCARSPAPSTSFPLRRQEMLERIRRPGQPGPGRVGAHRLRRYRAVRRATAPWIRSCHSNSMITSSTFRLAPAVALIVLTTPVRSALQDVFHLHRLDRGQRLTFLHLVAVGDLDLARSGPASGTAGYFEVSGGSFSSISLASSA